MDKDTINRTIAEAVGWHYEDDGDYLWLMRPDGSKALGHGRRPKIHPWMEDAFARPKYTDCLNAMNSAEKWLRGTDEEYHNDPVHHIRWNTYEDYLIRKFGVSASAKDRADTFVKVIEKWQPPTGEENE